MKRALALFAIAIFALLAQAPSWKEFSIAAPVKGPNRFSITGMQTSQITMKKALSKAYDVPEHRIIGPAWLPTERYAINAQAADAKEFQVLFQQELAARFHLLAHRETKSLMVYVLKSLDGAPSKQLQAKPANGSGESAMNSIKMNGVTVKSFADTLADVVDRPIFDETGLDGTFDFNLSWKFRNQAALEAAVKDQLAMQLVEDRRNVEVLVVDHIEKLTLQ